MNYRKLALLATRAADNQDLNEIFTALESLSSEKAYQLRNRISKQCEKTTLNTIEREVLDIALDSFNVVSK